jgi:tetratricopeptide (TPR) repeat protein
MFVLLMGLFAAIQMSISASASTQQPEASSADLTKKGFEYLTNWQCDKAILCFTPVFISQAKDISNNEKRKPAARLIGLIGRAFQIDENDLAAEQCFYFASLLDPDNKVYPAIRADILARCGRIDESDRILKSLHAQPGDKLIVTTVLASKLNREMNSGPAIKLLNQALATASDTDNLSGAYLSLARGLARVGITSEAHKYFKLAAENSKSPYLSKLYSGLAAQSLFDAAAAKQCFEEAGKILPNDPGWLNCLASSPILSDDEKLQVKKRAANCPRLSTDALVGYARRLSMRKRNAEALACADYLQKLRPFSFEHHLMRAKILQSTGAVEAAEKEYRAALSAQPDSANLYLEVAQFYVENKNFEDAEKTYFAGVKCCPSAEFLWSSLAVLRLKEGRLDDAKKCAQHALQLLPAKADRLNVLQQNEFARMHAILGNYDYKANNIDASFDHAKIFNQFKLIPKLPPILRIMEVRPDRLQFAPGPNAPAVKHIALADMLDEMRQLKDAIKEYRLALKEDPDSVDTHTFLLNVLWEDNQWLEAAQEDWSLSNKLVFQLPTRIEEIKKLFEQKPDEKQKYSP